MSTSEEKYISPRRLNDFKTLLESEYKIDKHSNQIGSLVDEGAKNLLKITATSKTISGVTFTVNGDGTVTVNGTNTGTQTALFTIDEISLPANVTYNLSGCPSGGSLDTYYLGSLDTTDWYGFLTDVGTGASGSLTTSKTIRFRIGVRAGTTVSNLTFKPMLCTAEDYDVSSEFVPYAPTNRELYNSIHGSFKNTTALSGITITNNSSVIISDLAIFNFSITSSNKISAGSATPVIQLNLGVLSSTSSRALICNTNTDLVIAWFNAADGRIYIKPSTEIPASTTIRMSGTIIL